MSFNTAIFYDIENLLKGYSFSQEFASNVSLKKILQAIRGTDKIGGIAVQRAYANWSDSRLNLLRPELGELGIDPIQVYGFGRDQKKNAADIQLAIDAIDLSHVRTGLEVFVIVSGDGGFASLAKKLHEYGKRVIGCAYNDATNRYFEAACDHFVSINAPEEETRVEKSTNRNGVSKPAPVPGITDARNIRLFGKMEPVAMTTREDLVERGRTILNKYQSDGSCRTELETTGIYLNIAQEALKATIRGFDPAKFGFFKIIEFLQHVCKGTNICVARPLSANSQAMLMMRAKATQNLAEILPDFDPPEPESIEGYRMVLSMESPRIMLPAAMTLRNILQCLSEMKPENTDLGTLVEQLVGATQEQIDTDAIKQTVLSLLSVDCFSREPEGALLSEQKISLLPDCTDPSAMLAMLRTAGETKLKTKLGKANLELLQQIIPATLAL